MTTEPGLTTTDRATPDYVLIGHVTRDVIDDGFVIGGTVTYAGLTALALGCSVGAVTSAGADLNLARSHPGVSFRVRASGATTTFENVYQAGHRQQWIRAVAAPLEADLVPDSWRSAPVVHLAPLVGEFGPEIIPTFKDCGLLGLTPQGWLRTWSNDGFVRRSPWQEPERALSACDAVVLSEEDVEGDWDVLRAYAMARDGDPINAAHYANCVASFAVEALGTSGIPTACAVSDRLRTRSPITAVI